MKCEYTTQDKDVMVKAAKAQNKSRLQELVDFAKLSGFKKIGIANCKALQEYADKLTEFLQKAGFEVFSMNCKESGLDGCEIDQEMSGPCCDPVAQAKFLNEKGTDFNINVGLCLGHGLLFQRYSNAEVTTILVKDFAHGHNMVAAFA